MEKAVITAASPANSDTEVVPLADLAFTRQQRLRESAQFQKIFAQPDCRATDPNFAILACRNGGQPARLGMAVSKRRIKRAVGRNRIKRLVRDSFRRHQAALAGLDIVVIDRLGAEQRDNGELFNALAQLWARLAKKCKGS